MKYSERWDLTTIPEREFNSERGRRLAVQRKTPAVPKKLRPCSMCGGEFGAREMLKHIPRCLKNPKNLKIT